MTLRSVLLVLLALAPAVAVTGCLDQAGPPETRAQTTTHTITLEPRQGTEFKLAMPADGTLTFTWNASAPVTFDMHGEPHGVEGDVFESYRIGTATWDEGTVTTRFAGQHGWFFENRGRDPVTIELTVEGTYAVIGEL